MNYNKTFDIYNKNKQYGFLNLIVNIFLTIIIILSSIFLIFSFVYISTPVVGASMQPTLNIKGDYKSDIVYINKFASYTYKDIIVIEQNDISAEHIIKRVIGLGGDKINYVFDESVQNYVITVNGTILDESLYVADYNMALPPNNLGMSKSYENFNSLKLSQPHLFIESGELLVPKDSVFALGDNRGVSSDSSLLGTFLKENIVGRVDFIIPYGQNPLKYFINRFTPFSVAGY